MNEANVNARQETSTIFAKGDGAVINIHDSNFHLLAANVGNRAPGQRESQEQQRNTVTEPRKDDKDLSWLCEGKIAFYKRRPLSKTAGKTDRKVYHGKQEFLPEHWREVAIKVIKYKEKNLNELNLLKKLSHPNIVQLFDAGKHRGNFSDHIYIVMELCSKTLTTYVEKNPFNFQKFSSFAKQIVEGLEYLHSNNVTHCDLKPDNVLFSICRKIVKLSDFGLSKEIPVGQSSVTVTKVCAGTDGYRPPETYQNTPRVSRNIDIFPFGLVTYFIFTNGKHAYGTNPHDWSVNIRKNQNRDLTKIPPFEEPHTHKKEQLIDLLLQTLQHNPKDRPTIHEIKQSAFFTGVEKDDRDVPGTSRKRKSQEPTEDSDQASRTKETKRNLSDERFAESPQDISKISITFVAAIHEGKFASVRKGYWNNQLVAVKEYKKDGRKLFEREFRSLNALRHENIVGLVGKISEEPTCLVLEYLKNGNLRDYLRRLSTVALSLIERMSMIRQIACGMTFLSNKKFIHGDLRTKNILVGKTGVYKIGGFHLSQSEANDEAVPTLQIRWSAPEVLSGGAPSIKSDVWSYAIVLHEIFAYGEVPYRGLADMEVKEKVLAGHRLQRPRSCPKDIFKMMSKCWDKNPTDRPEFEELQVFSKSYKQEPHANPGGGGKDTEGDSSKINVKRMGRIQEIQDELKKPLNEIGFRRSAQLLSELRELRGSDDLDTLLQMAECELQLARGKEEKSIQRTSEFISSSGWYSALGVRNMAHELKQSKRYIRSLILYRLSNDLYKSQNVPPDDAVKWIRNHVVHVLYAAKPLIDAGGRSRDIGIKYGLEYTESLLKNFREIANATPDVRVINEAECLLFIAIAYAIAGEYQKSIRFGSEGVEVLEKQFGSDAAKYQCYGRLLNFLGAAHGKSGNYSDAELYYLRAIEAYEKALDYENENEKRERIRITKRNLAIVRRLLGEQK